MTAPFPGLTIPNGFDVFDTASVDGAPSRLGVRRVRSGDLVDAYPAAEHDLELAVEGEPTPAEVTRVADELLAADPLCRRVVLPVPERDIPAIAWAEDAGFRYVVDVETRSGAFSLLVREPEWVLAQPVLLEDIPIKE